MGFMSEPSHWIIILVLVMVLFGAKRLPELGKGLGEGLKGFREGIKGVTEPSAPAPVVQQSAPPVQAAAAAAVTSSAAAGNMEYIVCTRCGNRFENPNGFKVVDFVCKGCQARS
jgi:sec-independent protein translocase protein TatA